MNPIPDRISRLIKESILTMLAHLQFRLTLTQGMGPNLSFPPAAMDLKCLPDKVILKNLLDIRNVTVSEVEARRRKSHGLAGTRLSD